jgi:hypothetical protein
MVKTMRTFNILILILFAAIVSEAFAERKRGIMPVETIVKPIISIKVLNRPEEVNVTDADLKVGYVDIGTRTILEVYSNIRSGLMLKFDSVGGPFNKMWVLEGEKKTVFPNMMGLIRQPHTKGKAIREFYFRFYLSEDAKASTYLWPLRISAEITAEPAESSEPKNN